MDKRRRSTATSAEPAPAQAPSLLDCMRSMRAVSAVVRHGSTVKAAETMHISQPAVARSIIGFEKAIKLMLFSRATRGMAPTPPGAGLAARIDVVLHHLARAAIESVEASPLQARPMTTQSRFASAVTPAQLRAIMAITAHGSEARAAVPLGVTQPAVHAALQRLEGLVGVRLFYKLAIGTRLTPAGEALLRRVKLALAEIRAMESDLAAWRGEVQGRIVIGVLPLAVTNFVPRAVAALVAQHPNIRIQLVDGTYESLVRQLLGADIDAIAGALRADEPDGELRQLHLFDDDLVVVVRAGHPILRRSQSSLAELLKWDWVTPLPNTPAERAIDTVFRSQGLQPPAKDLQASSPAMTLAFVMQTGRLALASRSQALVDNYSGQLCIVPMPLPLSTRRIGVATRAIGEPSHDLQLFLDACRSAVPQLDAPPRAGARPKQRRAAT